MKKKMKKSLTGLMILFLLLTFTTTSRAQTGFTQKDRELLIQIHTTFDKMEKRFDHWFDQIDKRFSELREWYSCQANLFTSPIFGVIRGKKKLKRPAQHLLSPFYT
jgi:hypothetical protein